MRKTDLFLILLLFALVTFVGCTSKSQSQENRVKQFRSQLTAEDTTAMLSLCDNAMEMLKQNKVDEVVASLCLYVDSTHEVQPLTVDKAKKVTHMFNMFPVIRYERIFYSFLLEGANDVKYRVEFATAENAGTEEAPTIVYMFNPVKVDGEWRLCMKDANDLFDRTMN